MRKVLQSGILAQGPRVAELEESFAKYSGTKYAVAVNSGTAALHAALFAAGVGEGDEVITTPFSFIATVNTILMVGAKPVLVDIDPSDFNLDPKLVEVKTTPKTKAIMPVHLYGQTCDFRELEKTAKSHGLIIIEDACQAVGALYDGKKAGSLGDLGCFSFYATKNLVSGEGGIVTTDNEDYATAMKRFRQHGMSATYEYQHLGYNYRTTDIHAAIAIEQLKKIDGFNAARQKSAAQYNASLKSIKGLVLPKTKPNRTHVFHQYTIRVTKDFPLSRDELAGKLREKEIGSGVYYPQPLHAVKHVAEFGYKMGDFPEAEKASREVLSLPIHNGVTEKDIDAVVKAIRDIADGKS